MFVNALSKEMLGTKSCCLGSYVVNAWVDLRLRIFHTFYVSVRAKSLCLSEAVVLHILAKFCRFEFDS